MSQRGRQPQPPLGGKRLLPACGRPLTVATQITRWLLQNDRFGGGLTGGQPPRRAPGRPAVVAPEGLSGAASWHKPCAGQWSGNPAMPSGQEATDARRRKAGDGRESHALALQLPSPPIGLAAAANGQTPRLPNRKGQFRRSSAVVVASGTADGTLKRPPGLPVRRRRSFGLPTKRRPRPGGDGRAVCRHMRHPDPYYNSRPNFL